MPIDYDAPLRNLSSRLTTLRQSMVKCSEHLNKCIPVKGALSSETITKLEENMKELKALVREANTMNEACDAAKGNCLGQSTDSRR